MGPRPSRCGHRQHHHPQLPRGSTDHHNRAVSTPPLIHCSDSSVRHGGNLHHGIPNRIPIDTPDKTNVRRVCSETDHNTAQLACVVSAALRAKGVDATLVVGKLLRSKVDLNRPESLCAESHLGFAAWHEYHGEIKGGIRRALQQHPYAHVFDLHGQGHRPAVEVGHMLPNHVLRECCGCAIDEHAPQSSYAAMASNLPDFSMQEAVRGDSAIGSLLEDRGFAAVPSKNKPHPCSCSPGCGCACSGYDASAWSGTGPDGDCRPCAFFWGGTTTQLYGECRIRIEGDEVACKVAE